MIAARAGVNSFGKMLEKSAQILNVCKADCAKKWVVISESGREFVSLVKKVGSDATALAYEDKVATLPKAIREEIASFNLGSIGKRFSAFNDYYHQLKWEGFAMGRCDVLARGLLRAVKNRAGSTSGGSVIGDGNVETARFTVDPRSSGIDVAVLDDDQTFQGLQNAMLGVKRDCKEAWQTNELKAHELESLATEVEQVLCCTFEEKAALLPVSSEDDENDISHQRDVWKAFSEHLQGLSTLVRKAVAEMHAMVENQAAVKSSRS